MSLHGRLYKDLFLSSSGSVALEHARQSARKYEEAFKATQGFYSGINAATMSLVAGYDAGMVDMRTRRVLELLPVTNDLDPATKYFTEATRAEAQYLLGNQDGAKASLSVAFNHDPLNYTAHASTLRQLRMISRIRGEDDLWLTPFSPPISVHFAGHIFGLEGEVASALPGFSQVELEALKIEISEVIQKNDIGFGFGALAAGADLLIAESLLAEGAELHVKLPVRPDLFKQHSVTPYGQYWSVLFETCLNNVTSVEIISNSTDWPNDEIDRFSSMISMGSAIDLASQLSVQSAQFLIWDGQSSLSGMPKDIERWNATGRPRFTIPYRGDRVLNLEPVRDQDHRKLVTFLSSKNERDVYSNVAEALEDAFQRRTDEPAVLQLGLTLELVSEGGEGSDLSDRIAQHALPGSLCVSSPMAHYIAVHHYDEFATDRIHPLDSGEAVFALRRKGDLGINAVEKAQTSE